MAVGQRTAWTLLPTIDTHRVCVSDDADRAVTVSPPKIIINQPPYGVALGHFLSSGGRDMPSLQLLTIMCLFRSVAYLPVVLSQ